MLKELFESLDEKVFTAELRESLETQFNEAVEQKASVIAQERIDEEIDVLGEKSEEHINMLNEKSEEHIEMLNEKSEEHINLLNEKSEEHIEYLDNKAEEYVAIKLDEMVDSVDAYLDKVVDDFVNEAKSSLEESTKSEKADMIIEAFDTMLVATGVDVARIVEAKDESAAENKLDESINKYDELLDESLQLRAENDKLVKLGIITEMKDGLSDKASKRFDELASIVEFSRDESYLKKLEMIRENVSIGEPAVDDREELASEVSSLQETVANLKDELCEQRKENDELIKLGVITELKEGLSIIQAEKFERLAKHVDFVNDESFVDKLEALKESVRLNNDSHLNDLNERYENHNHNEVVNKAKSAQTNSINSWSHLI